MWLSPGQQLSPGLWLLRAPPPADPEGVQLHARLHPLQQRQALRSHRNNWDSQRWFKTCLFWIFVTVWICFLRTGELSCTIWIPAASATATEAAPMIRPSLTPRPSWREVEVMGGTVRLQAKLQAGAAHRQAGQGDKEAERKMIFLCYVLMFY